MRRVTPWAMRSRFDRDRATAPLSRAEALVYTDDVMSSPSPEAPLDPLAYRPLPRSPSPCWRRSAQGLRWMRLAMYTRLAAATISLIAYFVYRVGERDALVRTLARDSARAIEVLTCFAYAAALWRFASVPASTGASRPARQSFWCFAALTVLVLPFFDPCKLSFYAHRTIGLHDSVIYLMVTLYVTLISAGLGLLVRALGMVLRALGEKPSTWMPKAVGAYIAWMLLSTPLPIAMLWLSVVYRVPRWAWSLEEVLSWAAQGAIILALGSVLGRTAAVLARQESPESELR